MYYPTYNRLDGLLAGIGLAAIFQYTNQLKKLIGRYANWLLVSGGILTACAYMLCKEPLSFPLSIFGFPLIAAAFGLIVAAAASADSILNRFSSAVTTIIATLSYAIYLTHKAAIHFTQAQAEKLGFDADSNTTFILSTLVAIALAVVLHYSIEQPFLKLKEHLLAKRRRLANISPLA